MMPHDRYRADLERAVGRNAGRLQSREAWPYVMELVYHYHFPGATALVEPWKSTLVGTGVITFGVLAPTCWSLSSGIIGAGSAILDWGAAGNRLMGFQRDASSRSRIAFSAVNNTAKLFSGFALTSGLGDVVDGLFFGIDGTISTGNFLCTSRKNGVATTVVLDGSGDNMNLPVDTAWHEVAITCDSLNSQVRFYVDNVLAATIATDLPSGPSDYLTPHLSVQNGLTATSRSLTIDVIALSEAAP